MNQYTFENKIIPWIVTLWFFVSINSFFLWFGFGRIIQIIAFFGMLFASLKLLKKFKITTYNLPIFLSLLVYVLWSVGFISNQYALLIKTFNFIPLFLLLFWPKDVFNDCYKVLRKAVIFFAIGSSVVSILSFVGVLYYLPHFTFGAHSQLHESKGIGYFVYGAFVVLYSSAGISSRACGPLQEPGHWAIILGLFYLIDWYVLRKRNVWIIICGILTFSSGFLAMVLFVEIFNLFSKKYIGKTIRYLSTLIIVLYIGFLLLPQDTKDQVVYLLFERNLESVFESFDETGSLDDALDARASDYSLRRYDNMTIDDFLFGTGYRDTSAAVSDYRGTILYMGLIGLILSIIPVVLIIRRAKWMLAVSLCLCLFLIYLHRGWMFFSSYIYFLAFLAVTLCSIPRVETDKYLTKKV